MLMKKVKRQRERREYCGKRWLLHQRADRHLPSSTNEVRARRPRSVERLRGVCIQQFVKKRQTGSAFKQLGHDKGEISLPPINSK